MIFAPRIDNIDKNYLMNGGMDLFQRFISPAPFSGVSLTTSFSYLNADRWAQQFVAAGMGATPATCSSTTVPNQLSKYSLNWIVTPISTNAEMDMYQRIEALVASELSGQVVSIGLMINSPSASQMTMELWVPQGPDNYTTESMIYTQTVAFTVGSWQQVKFENITLPSTVNGLEVRFRLSNWTLLSGPYNVYMTQFGLMKNSTFDGFNRFGGHITTEIYSCQRYFEKTYNFEVNPGTVTATPIFKANISNNGGLMGEPYKVPKRIPPSVTLYNPNTGSAGQVVTFGSGNIAATPVANDTVWLTFVSVSTSTSGYYHYTADAEL